MPSADVDAIKHALSVICERGSVHELRIPHAARAGTVSGYYDDLDALARDAGTTA